MKCIVTCYKANGNKAYAMISRTEYPSKRAAGLSFQGRMMGPIFKIGHNFNVLVTKE